MSILDEAVTRHFETQRRVLPQHTNRASQSGIECARRLQWNRSRWQDAILPSVDLQRRFALGNLFEPHIVRILEDAGITIEQRQRDLSWSQFQLTGHIDGIVVLPQPAVPAAPLGARARRVLEIKTTAKFSFERIRQALSALDLLRDDRAYIRGYVVQAALYALLLGLPGAFIFFVEKDSYRTHTVDVSLDDPEVLEAAERVLQRFERVNAAIAAGEDLPAEPAAHCDDCPFRGTCLPERSFGQMHVIPDDELVALVTRHEELRPAAAEYDDIDERLKEHFTAPGEYIAGDFVVIVKEQTTTRYEVPKDVKQQYAVKVSYPRRSFVRLAPPEAQEKIA